MLHNSMSYQKYYYLYYTVTIDVATVVVNIFISQPIGFVFLIAFDLVGIRREKT